MKDVAYIHKKIKKNGINSVVSVREDSLEFSIEATPQEITDATAIFNSYTEEESNRYNDAMYLVLIYGFLSSIKEVGKDITLPDDFEADL